MWIELREWLITMVRCFEHDWLAAIDPQEMMSSVTVLAFPLFLIFLYLAGLPRGSMLVPTRPCPLPPWGALFSLGAILLYMVITSVVLGLFIQSRMFQRDEILGHILATMIGSSLSAGLVLFSLVRLHGRYSIFTALGLTERGPRAVLIQIVRGMVCYLLLYFPITWIFFLAQSIWDANPHAVEALLEEPTESGTLVALTFVSVGIVAPVVEEFLFRGVLLGGLAATLTRSFEGNLRRPRTDEELDSPATEVTDRARANAGVAVLADPTSPYEPWSPPRSESQSIPIPWTRPIQRVGLVWFWIANLMVAMLFAALHITEWPAPVPLFFLALALGWLYRKSGSLVLVIAAHATLNLISLGVLLIRS